MRACLLATLGVLGVLGCSPVTPPHLLLLEEQSVAVNQTLHVQVRVAGSLGTALQWRMEAPTVADLRALLAPNPTGAEFRWTPLASDVGDHAITFFVAGDAGSDSETMIVHVVPPPEGAPVFLRPGAGQPFDPSRDPCVAVPVEVKDDDSSAVDLAAVAPLVDGSELQVEGEKLATWHWCPTPEQGAVSTRYTLHLTATDEAHEPTPHTFVVVLRTGNNPDCPGAAPSVDITYPENGGRVATTLDYPVDVTVSDDGAVREAPLLYYSLDEPEDGAAPDLTAFAQVVMQESGPGAYRGFIPNLDLPIGGQAQIWFLVSATDNDDAEGALCDHTTDSPLRTILVATPEEPDTVGYCEACSGDDQCEGGALCVIGQGGVSFCGAACGGGCFEGQCRLVTSRDGVVDDQCVPDGLDCSGGSAGFGTDDAFEDNDTRQTAREVDYDVYTDLQVCQADDDFYLIPVEGQSRIDVIIDGFDAEAGDLDLFLLDDQGRAVKVSAGDGASEEVSVCVHDPGNYVAWVAGLAGTENRYDMLLSAEPATCCVDDGNEDDDGRLDARALPGGAYEDGQICAGDDDWFQFRLTSADLATIDLLFDSAEGNLDLELYDPNGAVVASSASADDDEQIVYDSPVTGDFTIRVYGRAGDEAAYMLQAAAEGQSDCFSDEDCGAGRRCGDGFVCVDAGCTDNAQCGDGAICPWPGPGDALRVCASTCGVNADCGGGEACKGFAEGRACGVTGAGTNGAPCQTFADCSGQRTCLDVPNGYCAELGCATNFDCPQGSFCTPDADGGPNVCLKDCFAGADACRLAEGHECQNLTDTRGNARSVCVP